jgi:hypothetical protein
VTIENGFTLRLACRGWLIRGEAFTVQVSGGDLAAERWRGVMTSYFSVRDNRIVSLAVIRNQPAPY